MAAAALGLSRSSREAETTAWVGPRFSEAMGPGRGRRSGGRTAAPRRWLESAGGVKSGCVHLVGMVSIMVSAVVSVFLKLVSRSAVAGTTVVDRSSSETYAAS